mmetsp:Transcript_22560/g.34645  ORF Transcript_22560/g.34645 Transcript_22560/m.34645 type:complete len:322 (-) Transcript_22560:92-1057(-)|eukprot:CAMPEP_0196819908 /NCGR_PEP_ID=MMETSP1362-20130617/72861_1 /TAXON_ID=163516 /ORGANISM="Leptocylindrus danicus, Strain CCMP1856" /LENGTH=321 /DNA_ID=CAMNT_0042198571 /DNA_START=135 /DNA_END=1100 /DNA_ORIENTATION=+
MSHQKRNDNNIKGNGRVLSIQSHVVSGYVGNKAAVFPLQLLGFEVDIINSVHFSNHTGYPHSFEGDVMNGEQLRRLMSGLERNDLLHEIRHVLTGYIGSATFLREVLRIVTDLKSRTPGVRYVCDPVLGDNNKLYVPQELVEVYRNEIIPNADVVTPNQFEVEQLTGIHLKNLEDAKTACCCLHSVGPEIVIITSLEGLEGSNDEMMTIFASRRGICASQETEQWKIDFPTIKGRYTGTGDLCAALFLAWTPPNNDEGCSDFSFSQSLEKVVATMQCVIQRTCDASEVAGSLDSVAARELKLIASKADIEQPPIKYKAFKV